MATSLQLRPLLLINPNPNINNKSRSNLHLLKPYPSPQFPSSLNPPKPLPRRLGLLVPATKNAGGEEAESSADIAASEPATEEARGRSTMPERFRYLTKEAPDRPVRWPWAIALVFLVYCWRTVLWELGNWKNAALAILHFFGYLSKLALAFVFHFIGDPITAFIRIIESSLNFVRDVYSSIVTFAPVLELSRVILFASMILAIAEATVPDSVNSQPYLLTMAGVIGFGAVQGFILEPFFWLLLCAMFCYSRFIKKRDTVSSALPSAAALAAIGEPWVRGITIASYLALAIFQYSKSSSEVLNTEAPVKQRRLPLPLLVVSFAIGLRIAAKWIRYRHLTWMIA